MVWTGRILIWTDDFLSNLSDRQTCMKQGNGSFNSNYSKECIIQSVSVDSRHAVCERDDKLVQQEQCGIQVAGVEMSH